MKLLIALFCLSISACSSTPKEEQSETFEWNISEESKVELTGCENLKTEKADTNTKPDC
jgi:hypothetical protein